MEVVCTPHWGVRTTIMVWAIYGGKAYTAMSFCVDSNLLGQTFMIVSQLQALLLQCVHNATIFQFQLKYVSLYIPFCILVYNQG